MGKLNKISVSSHPFMLLFISILSVSISSIMIKLSDTPTSVAGMYRLFISVIIMLTFVPWKLFRSIEMNKKDWIIVLIAGLFLGLHFLFWMESLVYTSVASSMVIFSLQPLFVMLGSFFLFKERASRLTVCCLMVALLGSVLIAWGDIVISKEALIGDGLSLIGTLFVSAYLLAGQKVSRKIDANVYSIIVFFIGGTVMLVYNLFNNNSLVEYDSSEWTYFLLLAIIPTIFGQYIFNLLLKSIGATTISVGIIGEPVIAIILAYLLLGETISLFQFLGGMMTLFGMGLYFWSKTLRPNVQISN
ncbi:multidrug transporter [Paenibacillus pectinilyticus]|uniref:Multidrug transporter n=1 Tax=Paenibacillus pectinilyticus TaxID=512399 RepID=A0A1C1A7L1_9BACL|nr:DMT family transporter [Paenibacillus pectinilyticus]OCT16597.1 multidrug transporter [Paenibacillus pectinilyticus]